MKYSYEGLTEVMLHDLASELENQKSSFMR